MQMNWQRIRAIILHSWYHLNHSMETWIDLFWFSFINILVFGMVAVYSTQGGRRENADVVILGLILWNVVYAGQSSVTMSVLWEIWSKSLSSLFISPLTIEEFLVAQMIGGVVKAATIFFITAIVGIIFYHFSIFTLGFMLVIYFVELLVFAWASGIFILGLIFRFGTDIQSLAWGLIYLAQPLGAVFYPVTLLPEPFRHLAYALPVTYVFEAARSQLFYGTVETNLLLYATVLNIGYFIVCYWFMKKMLAWGMESGAFARMEN